MLAPRTSGYCLAMTILFSALGCSQHQQEAFKTVKVCVADSQGINRLAQIMRESAKAEGMTYIDNTAATRRGLSVTAQSDRDRKEAEWVVNFEIQGSNGMGVTATNLGHSPFEMALGFSVGSNRFEAESFAERLIGTLKARWRVVSVQKGEDSQKLTKC